VLLGEAGALPAGAGALEGAGADELGAADALADVAGLEDVDALFFLEEEQPANATAATRIGSNTRRCIFTTHSDTGSMEIGGNVEQR
jgi:hypothetical protein